MGRNTEDYNYEDEEPDHKNLDLRQLVHQDPKVGNDLILNAYKDASYVSKDPLMQKDDNPTPAERAKRFAFEMSWETSVRISGLEVGPDNYQEAHRENSHAQSQAAGNFARTIQRTGEDCIATGLLDDNPTQIEQGRTILNASLTAHETFAKDSEFRETTTETHRKFISAKLDGSPSPPGTSLRDQKRVLHRSRKRYSGGTPQPGNLPNTGKTDGKIH